MAKVRFSISMDSAVAERIKAAAARASQDVSTYVSRAALAAADHDERVADVFADIDARIAETEKMSADESWDSWPPPPLDGELSVAERAAIAARWDALFNTSEHGAA
jgi:hypothetical protein